MPVIGVSGDFNPNDFSSDFNKGVSFPAIIPTLAPSATQASAGTTSMNSTLLLDTVTWDLVLDANNNIAVAQPPYQLSQDAASACRLFLGELWYDTTQGIPFDNILGKVLNLAYLKAQLVNAAKSADPSIIAARVFITSILQRGVSGQV